MERRTTVGRLFSRCWKDLSISSLASCRAAITSCRSEPSRTVRTKRHFGAFSSEEPGTAPHREELASKRMEQTNGARAERRAPFEEWIGADEETTLDRLPFRWSPGTGLIGPAESFAPR